VAPDSGPQTIVMGSFTREQHPNGLDLAVGERFSRISTGDRQLCVKGVVLFLRHARQLHPNPVPHVFPRKASLRTSLAPRKVVGT
jgi:hypothetical protein